MRWDSPFVLAAAGTLAIHTLLAVGADAIIVTHPFHPDPPAPIVQLFEIEVEKPRIEPAVKREEPVKTEPVKAEPVNAPTKTEHVARSHVQPARPTPDPDPRPPPAPPDDHGGGETLQMADLGTTAKGMQVAKGSRTTGMGAGTGTGLGVGAGSGNGGAAGDPPVSVATIKTRALPRGDFSYYDLGKSYPAEAKALGIEGDIRVRLVVDEHGKVTSRTLIKPGLGHGLDELALERAAQIEFTPARDTDERPVSSVVVWTFHMTLPK